MQLSLDPAQQLAAITIGVRRSIDDVAGSITLQLVNDEGRVLGADSIRWTKPHDLAGLPFVVKETCDTFMWGCAADVLMRFRTSFREHVAALDLDAQGELRRLGTLVPLKRRRSR